MKIVIIILSITFHFCVFAQKLDIFEPNEKFQLEQPNFLKDGTYDFSIFNGLEKHYSIDNKYFFWHNYSRALKYSNFGDYAYLNSNKYPIKIIGYDETNLPKNLIYFLMSTTFTVFDNNILNNHFYPSIFGNFSKEVVQKRIKTREKLTSFLSENLKSKLLTVLKSQSSVCDFYDEVSIDRGNVFLQIVEGWMDDDQIGLLPYKRKLRGYLPTVKHIKLLVYNYKFELVKEYNQAVFLNSYKDLKNKEEIIIDYLTTSLLGQFSNDKKLLSELALAASKNINELDLKYIEFIKNEFYKQHIVDRLSSSFDMKDIALKLEESNKDFEFKSLLNTKINEFKYSNGNTNSEDIAVTKIGVAIGGFINDIFERRDRDRLAKDIETAKRMVVNYNELNRKQLKLISYLNDNNYINMDEFSKKMEKDNSMLIALENSIIEGATKVKEKLDDRKQLTNSAINDNFKILDDVDAKNNAKNKVVETNAITNDQNNTDCNKKSETEWKQSSEYQKCNSQTNVNTSQASCERAKAKLIEITLKNCRSQLPANEIQLLEKTKTDLLNRANQMDKDAFKRN